MLVGIDVSHPEPGSDRMSMAAVVGSMDGCAGQYVAHLSAQRSREEMVASLTESMVKLFQCFRERNSGGMPEHVLVYRDGVSDGQFDKVLMQELPCIKESIALMGYEEQSVKITILICQKGHNTRLQYLDGDSYVNLCPGMVVDGNSNSITSARINEFYLNSHVAIQGTAKPCKYSLIYDEIGFKMSELEMLTYWTCYLFARCNRSVSYATPAYYAHHASKRGKALFAGGATQDNLRTISDTFSAMGAASMFFI